MQSGFYTAAEIRDYLRNLGQQVLKSQPPASSPDGPYGPMLPLNEVAKVGNIIAEALVGSASDIRRNIVKYGSNVEEKQLEVLTDIRDLQERQMRQSDGILMAP
jgi:hypothetical protein